MTNLILLLCIVALFPSFVVPAQSLGPLPVVTALPQNSVAVTPVAVSSASIPQPVSQYPAIPLHTINKELHIPFVTSFPQTDDNSVVGKLMLAGVKNYLEVVKAFTPTIDVNQKIQLVNEGNNDIQGPDGFVKTTDLLKKSPILFSLLGTDSFLTLMNLIHQKKLFMLFPVEGSQFLREQVLENVIYFRPSQQEELEALVQYSVKLELRKKIALFYEASEWGENAVKTLEEILKKFGITLVAKASYAQGTVNVSNAITKISNESPNAVICIASPRATFNFIRRGINSGLQRCLFLGMSFLQTIQLLLKTSRGLDLVVSSVVPNPQYSNLAIVNDYKETLKSFLSYKNDSPFYLEAYITLALASEAIKKCTSEISIDSLIKSCEEMKNIDFKGLKVNFEAKTRALSTAVWINPRCDQPWISKQELDAL